MTARGTKGGSGGGRVPGALRVTRRLLGYRGARGYRWAAVGCAAVAAVAALLGGVTTAAFGPLGELSEVDTVLTVASGRLPAGEPLSEAARTLHDCRGGVLLANAASAACGDPRPPQSYPDGGRNTVAAGPLGWPVLAAGVSTPLAAAGVPVLTTLRLLAALGWALGVGLFIWLQYALRTPLSASLAVTLLLLASGPAALLGSYAGSASLTLLAGSSLLSGLVLIGHGRTWWPPVALIAQGLLWAMILPGAPVLLLAVAVSAALLGGRPRRGRWPWLTSAGALAGIALAAGPLWSTWWVARSSGTQVIALLDLDPTAEATRLLSVRDTLESAGTLILAGRGFTGQGWPALAVDPLAAAAALLLAALIAGGVLSAAMTGTAGRLATAIAAGLLGGAGLAVVLSSAGLPGLDPLTVPSLAALSAPALSCAAQLLGRSWGVVPAGLLGAAGTASALALGHRWG